MPKFTNPDRQKLSLSDGIRVIDFMRTIITVEVIDKHNVVKYADPWNDDRVAEHLRKTIPYLGEQVISRLRQEHFGMLHMPRPKVNTIAEAMTRVEALEALVQTLVARIEELEDGITRPPAPVNGASMTTVLPSEKIEALKQHFSR
jgi:hypothetical protein